MGVVATFETLIGPAVADRYWSFDPVSCNPEAINFLELEFLRARTMIQAFVDWLNQDPWSFREKPNFARELLGKRGIVYARALFGGGDVLFNRDVGVHFDGLTSFTKSTDWESASVTPKNLVKILAFRSSR